MRILIELEGVLADVADAYYAAHSEAVAAVGWSKMDQAGFWRLVRTQGREAAFLRGAKPLKQSQYHEHFEAAVESDEVIQAYGFEDEIADDLRKLLHAGTCMAVTLGRNVPARQAKLASCPGIPADSRLIAIQQDPRMRPSQLSELAYGDRQTLLVASSDALIRAASSTDVMAVGIFSGPTSQKRLLQGGAAVVFRDLEEFAESVSSGGAALLAAGMLPFTGP